MKKPIINVMPLVDIMLVLLLILMCWVRQPSALNDAHTETKQTSFVLMIDRDGLYSCRKTDTEETLIEHTQAMEDVINQIKSHATSSTPVILITLDQSAHCRPFAAAIIELRKNGYNNIKLAIGAS